MVMLRRKNLLLHAWAVQFTGTSDRLIDVGAERECLEQLEWQEITNGVWILDTIMTGILTLVYQQNER